MGFDLNAGLVFAQFFTGAITVADPYMTPMLTCFSLKKNPNVKTCVALNVNTFLHEIAMPTLICFYIYINKNTDIFIYTTGYIHLYYIFIHKYDKYEYSLYVNIDIGSTRVN